MNRESRRPVAVGLRLYRALANAFPYEFKVAYGDEMMQTAEDAIEPIWRQHGIAGLMRLLADIALRVPAEHLAEFRKDLRYGLRMLAASPGFTAAAVISLGLGITVAACAFSEMNAIILRPLPGAVDPDRLVMLPSSSYPAYERYRARTDVFADSAAYMAPVPFGVSLKGRSERIWGHLVTPSYFSTFGVRPVIGRALEDGQSAAVVVSYRFWRQRLGSDPEAAGKTLRIGGRPFTIAGVMPEEFQGALPMYFPADLYIPVTADPHATPELSDHVLDRRDVRLFRVVGRLRPGVAESRAEAALDTTARQLEQAYGEDDPTLKGRRVALSPGGKVFPLRAQDVPMVTSLPLVMVSLVLLIACSNVANMLLARAAGRRKEIAVRLALGAGRWRLVRQLLTESMLIAAGAGVLGFILSVWLMRMVSHITLPLPQPIQYDMMPDGRVVLFTLALIVLTGIAFGLVPALQATRADLTPALKEGGNVRLRRYRRLSLRNVLVLAQIAASLALLLVTGFLALGFRRSSGIDPGFDGRNLYLVSLDPVRDGYSGAQAEDFLRKLLERVKRLPGVTAATLTDQTPMSMGGDASVKFSAMGSGAREIRTADRYVVGTGYFETLGIPILAGRGFRKTDEGPDARAVLVGETLARLCWNGENPVGRLIEIGVEPPPGKGGPNLSPVGPLDTRPFAKPRDQFEVVGLVKDVRHGLGMQKPHAAIYFPLRAADYGRPSLEGVTLMARALPGGDVLEAIRKEIAEMDSAVTPINPHTMTAQLDRNLTMVRMAAWIYGAIGGFGLILASVGLAGVTAYSVSQRAREIGIRIAMGARRRDVLGLVMKEGLALVLIGGVFGVGGAWGATRVLGAFLSALSTTVNTTISDPILLVGTPVLLGSLTLLACFLPARRSTRIDPAVALRQE